MSEEKKGFEATMKSFETDDTFDVKVKRPLAYLCACGFNKFDIHPNTVTIISMIVGAGAAYFYAHGSYFYEGMAGLMFNIIAVLMLAWADVLDCTDGQLARLTGKTSRIGRILDGAAGFVWFVPIYLAFVYRFYYHHSIEFSWLGIEDTEHNAMIGAGILLALVLYAGFVCLSGRSRVSDYYIQIHLFFLKGDKGSELDNSRKMQEIYDEMPKEGNTFWRMVQKNYVNYTLTQEKATPQFQNLMARLKEKFGSTDNIPADFRARFRAESLKVMKYNLLIVFNFPITVLYICCLLDIPFIYVLFEVIIMSAIKHYTIYRHEQFCKKLAAEL